MPQVTINLPEGTSAAKVQKILDSYQNKVDNQYANGKAKREAVQALIKKHQSDYGIALAAAKKRHGIKAS